MLTLGVINQNLLLHNVESLPEPCLQLSALGKEELKARPGQVLVVEEEDKREALCC